MITAAKRIEKFVKVFSLNKFILEYFSVFDLVPQEITLLQKPSLSRLIFEKNKERQNK